MKTAIIDQEFLNVGNQNFHYSSFGEDGLLEFVDSSDDPNVIDSFLDMFIYFWEQGIPVYDVN